MPAHGQTAGNVADVSTGHLEQFFRFTPATRPRFGPQVTGEGHRRFGVDIAGRGVGARGVLARHGTSLPGFGPGRAEDEAAVSRRRPEQGRAGGDHIGSGPEDPLGGAPLGVGDENTVRSVVYYHLPAVRREVDRAVLLDGAAAPYQTNQQERGNAATHESASHGLLLQNAGTQDGGAEKDLHDRNTTQERHRDSVCSLHL